MRSLLAIVAGVHLFAFTTLASTAEAKDHVKVNFNITINVNVPTQSSETNAEVSRIVTSQVRSATDKTLPELTALAEQLAQEELRKRGIKVGAAQKSSVVRVDGASAKLVSANQKQAFQTASIASGVQAIKADLDRRPQAQAPKAGVDVLFGITLKF
jgi:hypothetical protein